MNTVFRMPKVVTNPARAVVTPVQADFCLKEITSANILIYFKRAFCRTTHRSFQGSAYGPEFCTRLDDESLNEYRFNECVYGI